MDTATPFRIDRIGIHGGLGTGLLVGVVVAAMLAELPPLRGPVLGGLGSGLLLALALILSRQRQPLQRLAPRAGGGWLTR